MSCFDAIALGESREIFYLDLNQSIRSFLDGMCLTMLESPSDDKPIALNICNDAPI